MSPSDSPTVPLGLGFTSAKEILRRAVIVSALPGPGAFCKAEVMTYFLEYTIPAGPGNAEFEFPHDEVQAGETIPLSETNAEIIHTPELPARTAIIGATVPEAKLEAEQLIIHSRASEGTLYDDPSNSLREGIGRLVATFRKNQGWQDAQPGDYDPSALSAEE